MIIRHRKKSELAMASTDHKCYIKLFEINVNALVPYQNDPSTMFEKLRTSNTGGCINGSWTEFVFLVVDMFITESTGLSFCKW